MSTIADDARAMLQAGAEGVAKGAALGSIVPGVGTAIGGAVGGLLGVATSVLPSEWLGAGETAIKAAAAVERVTGTSDPKEAASALAADPSLAADLRVQLVQMANEARAEENRALEARIQMANADLASARGTMTHLADAKSPLEWGAPIVSVLVAVGFFVVTGMLVYGKVPTDAGAQAMLNQMVGVLTAAFSGMIAFWIGSSAGSARKTKLLAQKR